MRACMDVPIKKVAIVFDDGSIAVNLYTGKDYLDYDRNPDKYSKYVSEVACTYEHLNVAIAKDKETGGYIICK